MVALGGDRQIFPSPTNIRPTTFSLPRTPTAPRFVSFVGLSSLLLSSSPFCSPRASFSPVSHFSQATLLWFAPGPFVLPFTATSHLCCLWLAPTYSQNGRQQLLRPSQQPHEAGMAFQAQHGHGSHEELPSYFHHWHHW